MEVHPEVYRWLGALHVIDPRAPAPSVTRSGRVMLDEQTSMDFENGQVRAVASPRPFRVVPRPGEYRPTRKLSTCAGDPTPRATRSVAPSRATRARSTLSRVPKRAPSVPRAHPDPATRPPTHPRGGPRVVVLSFSSPSVPPDRLSRIRRAPLQSRRPARHAPPRSTPSSPANPPSRECTTGTSSVPCSAPLRHHPRGRRQGARRRRRPRLRVPHPLQVLRAHRRRSIHDHSPSHSYYEEDEPVDIDNGAVTNADPSPLTSHLAEMGLSDSRGFPGEDDPDAGAGSLPPAQGKLPGERGPTNAPLRSADASDPFRFMHDPNAPQTPLELLGTSIEGPFGLKRGEGEVLLSRQPATFQEWMKGTDAPRRNSRARGSPVMNWLEVMRAEVKTLAAMMTGTPEAHGAHVARHRRRRLRHPRRGTRQQGQRGGHRHPPAVVQPRRRLKDFPRSVWRTSGYQRRGPSVQLARTLVECARGYDATNIRVGDAKAAADAARQAAADAAQGYAPDYAASRIAPSAVLARLSRRRRTRPDPRWREASATAAATAELVERFCRGSPKHLKAFLLEDLRVAADARTNPKPHIDALNVLMPALLARGPRRDTRSPPRRRPARCFSRRFDARKAPRTSRIVAHLAHDAVERLPG